MCPLFDSYNNMVSTASMDELCRTVIAWLEQHCSLVALRPGMDHLITVTKPELSLIILQEEKTHSASLPAPWSIYTIFTLSDIRTKPDSIFSYLPIMYASTYVLTEVGMNHVIYFYSTSFFFIFRCVKFLMPAEHIHLYTIRPFTRC